jgi:hypothetical protein
MFGIRKSIATALIVGGLTASTVKADGPTVPPVQPAPAAPAQLQQPAKAITVDQLGQLLASTGLSFTPNKNSAGVVDSYTGRVSWSEGWASTFFISLSQNDSYVWIDVGLQSIANPGTISADAILKLLHSNGDTGTTFFYLDSTNMLRFYTVVSVDGLTPAVLKSTIQQIENNVMTTSNLWSQVALGQVPPAPPANPAPAPIPPQVQPAPLANPTPPAKP